MSPMILNIVVDAVLCAWEQCMENCYGSLENCNSAFILMTEKLEALNQKWFNFWSSLNIWDVFSLTMMVIFLLSLQIS